mgnify:CR=1 FL=1
MIKLTTEEKKEKNRIRHAKYRLENKEKLSKARAKYRLANKENINLYAKKYREENKGLIKEGKQNYINNNPLKVKEQSAKWFKENKDKSYAVCAQYRARKFNATVYMTDKEKKKIEELYQIAQDATKLFGYVWAVDHIIPLNKGGLHKLTNLQVVPATWNSVKGDRNSDLYWGWQDKK